MQISVDIARVNNHIPILQAELREAVTFEEYLRKTIVAQKCLGNDVQFLEAHRKKVADEANYIRNRISFLESIVTRFASEKDKISELLDGATKQASVSDVLF